MIIINYYYITYVINWTISRVQMQRVKCVHIRAHKRAA